MSRLRQKRVGGPLRAPCLHFAVAGVARRSLGERVHDQEEGASVLLLMAMAISRMVPLIENLDTLQVQMNERVKREAGRQASERENAERLAGERKKMDGTARERERVNKIIGSQVDEAAAIDWRKNLALLVCRGA
jgi:hypothetical protein